MSDRSRPSDDQALVRLLRDVEDRLRKIEGGLQLTGRVSLGNSFFIGNGQIRVDVVAGAGGSLKEIHTNVATGATYTITL